MKRENATNKVLKAHPSVNQCPEKQMESEAVSIQQLTGISVVVFTVLSIAGIVVHRELGTNPPTIGPEKATRLSSSHLVITCICAVDMDKDEDGMGGDSDKVDPMVEKEGTTKGSESEPDATHSSFNNRVNISQLVEGVHPI